MKKFKKVLGFVLATFLTATSFAQSSPGEIKGTVIDEDGVTMPGAVVSVNIDGKNSIKVLTDLDGKFTIKPLNPGTYDVLFVAFEDSMQINSVEVNPDKITWLKDTKIEPSIDLVGVTILEYAIPLIKPEDPTAITITAKQIENSPSLRDPVKLVSEMSSEISVGANGEAYVRGSRSDAVAYYVDGVKLTGTISPLPGRAIGSVTVYTGGVPAKYGDVTGGVIILETKSYMDLFRQRNRK